MEGDLREIDEMISDKDYRAMEAIARAKRQMTSYFDRKKLLEEMLRVIEKSQCIRFSSDRSKRFVDPVRPVFKLRLVMDKAVEVHGESTRFSISERNTEKEVVDFRMDVIHREVVSPFSEIMRAALKGLDKELLADIPDEIELAKFIVSSIFQVKTESDPPGGPTNPLPIVYLEYTL